MTSTAGMAGDGSDPRASLIGCILSRRGARRGGAIGHDAMRREAMWVSSSWRCPAWRRSAGGRGCRVPCSASRSGGTRSPRSASAGRIRCTTGCGPTVRSSYGRPYRQWFVFGYDEVHEVLRSPHTATAPVGELLLSTSRYRRLSPSARSNFSRWLLVNDAPDHTRLRSAVGRAFTPHQIDRYEPLIGQVVGDLAEALDTSSELDIVDGVHDQAADRGDRRRARSAGRPSGLAAGRVHGRSAGCSSR